MAELAHEAVREIVREEVAEIKQEVRGLGERLTEFESNTLDAINRVIEMVQALSDEDRDEAVGVRGRLHSHVIRIARLERLSSLR